ncbi:hypothetical protein K461DRAFT_275909 [Myriangium duriaei CBS 260.36]|uniref:Uncharacterized protein n=1 Tax=Myriangium duriaei CBS 260.36 TaxID=1168546 RepID=A0A9P4J4N4_9PEZI|nr:hypothetical protein K461DRAFT_275909 [Myriangium duriaei CBS 260.36]
MAKWRDFFWPKEASESLPHGHDVQFGHHVEAWMHAAVQLPREAEIFLETGATWLDFGELGRLAAQTGFNKRNVRYMFTDVKYSGCGIPCEETLRPVTMSAISNIALPKNFDNAFESGDHLDWLRSLGCRGVWDNSTQRAKKCLPERGWDGRVRQWRAMLGKDHQGGQVYL